MKKLLLMSLLTVFVFAGEALAFQCGIPPIPPIPPIGTTSCTPVCVCDANGNNCSWQFVCR